MAKENIGKFFEKAMTDRALAAKVAVLAAESGYEFTAAELLEFGDARPISDVNMDAVSGGKQGSDHGICSICGSKISLVTEEGYLVLRCSNPSCKTPVGRCPRKPSK